MATPSWLDDVQRELMERRVCAAYRERLLEELRDHIDDLCCEERNHAMSAETWDRGTLTARLGHPREIAAAADRHESHALFARRHPIITYLLTPIPVLIVLWIAYVAGLAGILSGFESYKDTAWAVQLAGILIHGVAYVPAVALTLVIAWVAIRSRTKVAWWLTAAGLVAIVSGMMMVSLSIPTTPGTGRLEVGLGFPPSLSHWPQFLIPLALTAIFVVYAHRKGNRQPLTMPE
jgi:hypothetical protein